MSDSKTRACVDLVSVTGQLSETCPDTCPGHLPDRQQLPPLGGECLFGVRSGGSGLCRAGYSTTTHPGRGKTTPCFHGKEPKGAAATAIRSAKVPFSMYPLLATKLGSDRRRPEGSRSKSTTALPSERLVGGSAHERTLIESGRRRDDRCAGAARSIRSTTNRPSAMRERLARNTISCISYLLSGASRLAAERSNNACVGLHSLAFKIVRPFRNFTRWRWWDMCGPMTADAARWSHDFGRAW